MLKSPPIRLRAPGLELSSLVPLFLLFMFGWRCLSAVLVAHGLSRALGAPQAGTSADMRAVAGEAVEELREDEWPTNATRRQLSNDKPATVMTSSETIANSNRKGRDACKCPEGKSWCPGFVCTYECDTNYLAIGQHVYRKTIEGVVSGGFSGGRCVELCPGPKKCSESQAPIRYRDGVYQSSGECFKTLCIDATPLCKGQKCSAKDAALMEVAKGNWALWQMARSDISGLYVDNIDLNKMAPAWHTGKADVTGCGLIMECVAHAMGWQTTGDAQSRVLRTLQALSNEIEGVRLVRSVYGNFFAGVFDTRTGETRRGSGGGNIVATGLLFSGVLFAKTYFERVVPQAELTQVIANYAQKLFNSIKWDHMMCNSGNEVDPQARDGIAWSVTEDGTCDMPARIRDGKIQFNEAYVVRWLAYEWACTIRITDTCKNMEHVWNASQAVRKQSTTWTNAESAFSTDILSTWGSYVVQLPFYTAHPFNSDPAFNRLFFNSWSAEKDLYTHAPFYSTEGYGLGAGPTANWCAGTGYAADKLNVVSPCLTYTPEGTVGYLPAALDEIKEDVLKMLHDGQAVTLVQDTSTKQQYPFLARRMLVDPEWRPWAVTMIDLSAETFGLAAYFLGKEFFIENTNHFKHRGESNRAAMVLGLSAYAAAFALFAVL